MPRGEDSFGVRRAFSAGCSGGGGGAGGGEQQGGAGGERVVVRHGVVLGGRCARSVSHLQDPRGV